MPIHFSFRSVFLGQPTPGTGQAAGTFDFPDNPSGVVESIKSISIDISHTWAGDLDFTITTPGGGVFNLADNEGGSADLDGVYTFVQSGGSDSAWPSAGGGPYNANSWVDGPFEKNGWSYLIDDPVGGDGGTVRSITIEFNKSAIPEPGSALALLGLGVVAAIRRRR